MRKGSFEAEGFGRNWRNMLPGRTPERRPSETVLGEKELTQRRLADVYAGSSHTVPLTMLPLLMPRNGAKTVSISLFGVPGEQGGSVEVELIDAVQGLVLVHSHRFSRERLLNALRYTERNR